ncbi:unnamed protein product [Kuraishia capsulata CBS 1993]|uniref:DNA polymerase n=1 Tax=Kuraishia capsulata CBS 1993 TaxID=1382522 RepID=W6MJI8_9ASCO|nr:uncharacterized protein KUCA_T00002413001 [Kuraishia capsulata CBS 1993]CDK26441.1 unnamed protein product [Kuraishia capsulata CBS 1993]
MVKPSENSQLFKDIQLIVVPGALTKVASYRKAIWRKQGATVSFRLSQVKPEKDVYIICETEEYETEPEKVLEKLKVDNVKYPIVKLDWLTDSVRAQKLLPTENYVLKVEPKLRDQHTSISAKDILKGKKRNFEESRGSSADLTDDDEPHEEEGIEQGKLVGILRGSRDEGESDPNALVLYRLGQMADEYKGSGRSGVSNFKALSYRRAINSIRQHGKKLKTYEDAIKLPDVGDGIARKIEEINRTGQLHQLDEVRNDEHLMVVKTFLQIYGVGMSQAQEWYNRGYRETAEIEKNEKDKLSGVQRLGLKYLYDWSQRIPRAEVAEHEAFIKQISRDIDPDFEVDAVGSYARGAENSGDVDFIVCKKDIDDKGILGHFLYDLVSRLQEKEYIKCSLINIEVKNKARIRKFYGGGQLKGHQFCRRIDFLLVPWSERGAASIYFVGDDLFNRTIRSLAMQKHMKLNHKGLFKDKRDSKGHFDYSVENRIEAADEKRIFEILGVNWIPPEQRNLGKISSPGNVIKESGIIG